MHFWHFNSKNVNWRELSDFVTMETNPRNCGTQGSPTDGMERSTLMDSSGFLIGCLHWCSYMLVDMSECTLKWCHVVLMWAMLLYHPHSGILCICRKTLTLFYSINLRILRYTHMLFVCECLRWSYRKLTSTSTLLTHQESGWTSCWWGLVINFNSC